MSFWPNRGEADARPQLGEKYVRLEGTPAAQPALPATT
jgi:cholesterol oxidase